MVSKTKEEERRFQIELLKIEVDLENLMALIIGTMAFFFAVFVYYVEIGQVVFQIIAGIALLLVVYVGLLFIYPNRRKRRFKDLEEQFITKKKSKQKKEC